MKWLRTTYLYRLYHYQKFLFWIVVFFVSGTLFCTFRGNQTIPFWVWGMYSSPSPSFDSGTALLMFNQSGETIPFYTQKGFKTRFFLHSPLIYYQKGSLLQEDPRKSFFQTKAPAIYSQLSAAFEEKFFTTEFDLYGEWLKRYVQSVDGKQTDKIYILNYHYSITSDDPIITHTDTLYVF